MIKNKRAQIGETLTWFVATIIIFFMMFLFTWGVGSISLIKAKALGGSEISVLSLETKEEINFEQFLIFLDRIYEGKKVRDLVETWSIEKDKSDTEKLLKKAVDEFVKSNDYPCYRFILLADETRFEYYLSSEVIGEAISEPYKSELEEYSKEIYIWDTNMQVIKVNFYFGECYD
jgi:hypothetical protein